MVQDRVKNAKQKKTSNKQKKKHNGELIRNSRLNMFDSVRSVSSASLSHIESSSGGDETGKWKYFCS